MDVLNLCEAYLAMLSNEIKSKIEGLKIIHKAS